VLILIGNLKMSDGFTVKKDIAAMISVYIDEKIDCDKVPLVIERIKTIVASYSVSIIGVPCDVEIEAEKGSLFAKALLAFQPAEEVS
jgi:hypothetical protein